MLFDGIGRLIRIGRRHKDKARRAVNGVHKCEHRVLIFDSECLEPHEAVVLDEGDHRHVQRGEARRRRGVEGRLEVRKVLHLRVEVKVEVEVAVLRDEVDLGEHVDVRQLELEHRAQREEQHGDVLRGVGDVVRVAEVHRGELGASASVHMGWRGTYPERALR